MPENKESSLEYYNNLAMQQQREDESVKCEMPRYRCHKEVWALKIMRIELDSDKARCEQRETDGSAKVFPADKGYAPFMVDAAYLQKHKPESGGYYVVYADGYKSYSPAKAFEDGYTKV